jgi:riboflavin kinase/FMN adenylyltransferase
MQVIRGLSHLKPFVEGCVLTIGNFDGVHTGHQAVIEKLAIQAKGRGVPVVVMLFEPQPREFFAAANAPSRLTRLREKVIQFNQLPVDYLLVVKFSRGFADCLAEDFVRDYLVTRLRVKHLVIGDDFHFGKGRTGNYAMLKQRGEHYGFTVQDMPSYYIDGHRVSSTLIRDALGAGDLECARRLLGRDYSVCGRVAHGNKMGRQIGFPTANIEMFRTNSPVLGVFAVTMTGIENRAIRGVANVGTRPTLDGSNKIVLETHLFDFDRDIYGEYVEVHFKQKLRDETRFSSIDALKQQIQIDINQARAVFS